MNDLNKAIMVFFIVYGSLVIVDRSINWLLDKLRNKFYDPNKPRVHITIFKQKSIESGEIPPVSQDKE